MQLFRMTVPAFLLGVGTLVLAGGLARLNAPIGATEDRPAPEPKASEMVEAAQQAYEGHLRRSAVEPEKISLEHIYQWSWRWQEAQRAASGNQAARIEACQAHLERMKTLEARWKKMFEQRFVARYEVSAATYYRAEAEKLLREAKER